MKDAKHVIEVAYELRKLVSGKSYIEVMDLLEDGERINDGKTYEFYYKGVRGFILEFKGKAILSDEFEKINDFTQMYEYNGHTLSYYMNIVLKGGM